jgi:hypothetical protein
VPDAERDAWLRARVALGLRKEGSAHRSEANALGTLNVTSDAPGLRDTVRHETGFRSPRPPSRLAAIESCRGDALAERMSRPRWHGRALDPTAPPSR